MNPVNAATLQDASGRTFHSPLPISEQEQHSTRDDAILLASFASIASEKSSSSRQVSPVATSSSSKNNTTSTSSSSMNNNKSIETSSLLLLSRTFPALPVLEPKRTAQETTTTTSQSQLGDSDEQSRPRAISYASHEVPIRSAATLLQLQPSKMTRVHHERPLAPKVTLSGNKPLETHMTANATVAATPKVTTDKPPTIILRKKFSWKHYPPLEDFLSANREEYLRFSTMNYTIQQKKYNNTLTEQMIALAQSQGYIFDSKDFSFVTVRDRIRCYYKSYVQSLKKRGIVVGYAARKLGIISEQDMKECAKLKAKIYVPRK